MRALQWLSLARAIVSGGVPLWRAPEKGTDARASVAFSSARYSFRGVPLWRAPEKGTLARVSVAFSDARAIVHGGIKVRRKRGYSSVLSDLMDSPPSSLQSGYSESELSLGMHVC